MLFLQYLLNNGVRVSRGGRKPETDTSSHAAPLKQALEHERYVTQSSAIYTAAAEEKDYRAMQMLDWFVAIGEGRNATDRSREEPFEPTRRVILRSTAAGRPHVRAAVARA